MRTQSLLLLLCGACAGSPEQQAFTRPLVASGHSLQQLWEQDFSPTAMARKARHLGAASGELVRREASRPADGKNAAVTIAATESGRLRPAAVTASSIAAGELRHAAAINLRPIRDDLAPAQLGRLAETLRLAPVWLLRLDHRPLADPRDPEHYTGDGPPPPAPGLLERILLRVW